MIGHRIATLLLCWSLLDATVVRVIDADTFEADIPIWIGLTARERIRLLGVDTWELRTGEPGQAAKAFTARWLGEGEPQPNPFSVSACGRDGFGRLLGRVTRNDEDLAALLILHGHGVPYRGRSAAPP